MSGALEMWTVYDHPRDFPEYFVARKFLVEERQTRPTAQIVACGQLAPLREWLAERGLVPLARNDEDDPCIVETWL